MVILASSIKSIYLNYGKLKTILNLTEVIANESQMKLFNIIYILIFMEK